MTKVYVVSHGYDWEGSSIEDIFDSWEAALQAIRDCAVGYGWPAQIGGRIERDQAIWRNDNEFLQIQAFVVKSSRAD